MIVSSAPQEGIMYTHPRHLLLTASAMMALVALPADAQVQTVLQPINVTEHALRADRLDQEAVGYEHSDMSLWRKAASLRTEAATLRTLEDPKGSVSLYWAARDLYYTGDEARGRKLMVQSAERALAIGDIVQAATAFIEAAYIASELRDFPSAREYVSKARLLAHSPMLTGAQREQLRVNLPMESVTSGLLASIEKP
jgi:hypothetical protein